MSLPLVTSAADALARYEDFHSTGRLSQGLFHGSDEDGREIACALGFKINSRDASTPFGIPTGRQP